MLTLTKFIGERFLDLTEHFNVTTCKISNFLKDILQIERRIFSEAIKMVLVFKATKF